MNGQLNHQRECVCSDWMSECQGINVVVLHRFGVCFGFLLGLVLWIDLRKIRELLFV